jgi:acetyltransferase-like isoleucine patch superfamily enzyme
MYSFALKFSRYLKRIIIRVFLKNVRIDNSAIIDFNVSIINKGLIKISKDVYLRGRSRGYQAGMPFPTTLLVDVSTAELKIECNCRINGAYIHAQKSVTIGKNCVIASGVNIMDSNGHIVYSSNRTEGRDEPDSIFIGDNVWIGLNSIILKGTNIGHNSIVAAGSVVKGDFPNNSLIQGNPALAVKMISFNDSHS